MPNFWNDLTKWLDDASKVVGREAGDLTLKGRLKLEIFELNRSLRNHFADLGALVFEQAYNKKNAEWKKNNKVSAVIKKIRRDKRLLAKKQAQYKKVGKKTTKKRR